MTCGGGIVAVKEAKCFRHVFTFDKLGKTEQIKQQVRRGDG